MVHVPLIIYSPQVRGKGPARRVSLRPLRVFACEMVDLLTVHPDGLVISKIVPAYKEKFKKDLSVVDLGFPKLIRVLEAIEDTVEVCIFSADFQCWI